MRVNKRSVYRTLILAAILVVFGMALLLLNRASSIRTHHNRAIEVYLDQRQAQLQKLDPLLSASTPRKDPLSYRIGWAWGNAHTNNCPLNGGTCMSSESRVFYKVNKLSEASFNVKIKEISKKLSKNEQRVYPGYISSYDRDIKISDTPFCESVKIQGYGGDRVRVFKNPKYITGVMIRVILLHDSCKHADYIRRLDPSIML